MKWKWIVTVLLLCFGAGLLIRYALTRPHTGPYPDVKFYERERAYQRIAYQRIGQEIARRHPGAKILLIKYKSFLTEEGELTLTEMAQMNGFKEGLNGKAEILVVKEVNSGMEDMMDSDANDATTESAEKMKEEMLTADMFNKLVVAHKNCNVVVSFAGLPPDYQLMTFWKEKDPKTRPALVLANAYLYELKFAFDPKQRFITAALAHRSVPFDPSQPVPKDEGQAFDLRYLMVTPDNVDQIDRENPDFFKSMRKK